MPDLPTGPNAWALAIGLRAVPFFIAALTAVLLLSAIGCLAFSQLGAVATRRPQRRLQFVLARLALAATAVACAALVFAEMTEVLQGHERMGQFDTRLAEVLAQSLSPSTLQFFSRVTHLGDPYPLTGLVVALTFAGVWRGHRSLAFGGAAACAGNAVLNLALKQLFERARPVHEHGYALADGFSFPSGHSSGSVVVYGMLAYVLVRQVPARWHLPAVLAAAAIAFTVGCSRIFLQVHWASDVLAGFASGSAWLIVCIVGMELLRYRQRIATR